MKRKSVVTHGESSKTNVSSGMISTDKVGKTDPDKPKRKYTKRDSGFWKKTSPVEEVGPTTVENTFPVLDIKTQPQSLFTVKEILDIIKTGNESNLAEFRFNGLFLSFKSPVAKLDLPKAVSKISERQTQDISDARGTTGVQGLNYPADKNLRDEIEDLFLSDPERAEQVMIDSMARENALNEGEIS